MQYSRDCITITSNNLFFHFQKHPHLCGENPYSGTFIPTLWETSPPAWGKPGEKYSSREVDGNIPTCVGKTDFDVRLAHYLRKHPHLRGENRGRRPSRASIWRNIPTCVGKTVSVGIVAMTSRKHPHLRGENRARTTLDRSIVGNIPTCVGKTHEIR